MNELNICIELYEKVYEKTLELQKLEDVERNDYFENQFVNLSKTVNSMLNDKDGIEIIIESALKLSTYCIDGTSKITGKEPKELIENSIDIMKRKNGDYAGDNDFFHNFTQVEKKYGITDTEIGFLVRMSDKVSRISTLYKNGGNNKVKDEKLEDTLLDLANYCILFSCYIKTKGTN